MIRKFTRKVMSEGIVQEMKKREFYLKPSLARKQKKEDARREEEFLKSGKGRERIKWLFSD